MFEMMLKSMGYDPVDFKAKMTQALDLVATFDQRLANIEKALHIDDAKFTDKTDV
jgi:hypothetical protein